MAATEETGMEMHSRQALVGDFGGTFISLGIADIDELGIDQFALLNTADFSNPMDAVERYLKSVPKCPDKVSLAVAGPLSRGGIELTRRGWTISEADVRKVTGASTITFTNDVDALALAVPALRSSDLVPIGGGKAVANATKLVIASGTGLGVDGLVWTGERWKPVGADSAGLVSLAVATEDEFDMRRLLPEGDRLTAERVFSGRGLNALYRGLALRDDEDPEPMTPVQITRAGVSGTDPFAAHAIELMAVWLARFAADMALLFGASGGVYLAGALAANIMPQVEEARLRRAFEDKGRASDYLRGIPVNVVKMGADAGLRGAAIALAQQLPAAAARKPLSQAV